MKQTKELRFCIDKLAYLELLYHELEEKRSTLHSDILRMIGSESIEKLYPDLSVFASLKNEILSEDEIKDIEHLLSLMFQDLRKSRYEHSGMELLLIRWITLHKEILLSEQ